MFRTRARVRVRVSAALQQQMVLALTLVLALVRNIIILRRRRRTPPGLFGRAMGGSGEGFGRGLGSLLGVFWLSCRVLMAILGECNMGSLAQ